MVSMVSILAGTPLQIFFEERGGCRLKIFPFLAQKLPSKGRAGEEGTMKAEGDMHTS